MKRKRFIKRLMAHGVPRNRAVAVADLVCAARVPYKNVNVIGLRPNYEDFTAYITFDCHLYGYDLKRRIETLAEGTRRELNKIIKKNKEKRAKELAKNPWLLSYCPETTTYFNGAHDLNLQGTCSHMRYHGDSPIDTEMLRYLNHKRSIAGLPALQVPEDDT